jgi:hypothetical protein
MLNGTKILSFAKNAKNLGKKITYHPSMRKRLQDMD